LPNFRCFLVFGMAFFCVPALVAKTASQKSTQSPSNTNAPAPAQHSKKHKSKHADDFLVKGTVFTPEGFAFPGVELHIRRAAEKKFRWETYTDSRGEFAVRVKQGSQYQVVARVKGFKDQEQALDATSGSHIDDMVFRMERGGGNKR
jgi:Carboxypeptidase regulatory-like domain